MYNCPYCNKEFNNWKSTRGHTSTCEDNTHEYYINEEYGCIHYLFFENKTYKEVRKIYPNIPSLTDVRKKIQKYGISTFIKFKTEYSDQDLLDVIKQFVGINNRIPSKWEFTNKQGYPDQSTYFYRFGSWNKAIETAGFKPDYNDGYGIRALGNDKVLYRSFIEAYFCDNFLYGKYKYIVEPKYPEPHNKYYDWYLPELDLYIELDGGLRPNVIQDKIEINKRLNRQLLVLSSNTIYDKTSIKEIMAAIA